MLEVFVRCALVSLVAGVLIANASAAEFSWPLRCPDGSERQCLISVSHPDVDGDGHDALCRLVVRRGHTGTDIVPSAEAVSAGVAVLAAAPGTVAFVQDEKFDQCPADHPHCRPAARRKVRPGITDGYTTCTTQGLYCSDGGSSCFWCFSGNYVVIDHGEKFTAYLHLKKDSVAVEPGQRIERGETIGLVGSSGNSDRPHLHFEVWRGGLFKPINPWRGACGSDDASWSY